MSWLHWILAGSIIAALALAVRWVWKNQAPPTLKDVQEALKTKNKDDTE